MQVKNAKESSFRVTKNPNIIFYKNTQLALIMAKIRQKHIYNRRRAWVRKQLSKITINDQECKIFSQSMIIYTNILR